MHYLKTLGVLLFSALLTFSHGVAARGNSFGAAPLKFYSDKVSNIASGDVVRWHLDLPYEHGQPITCTVKWVIPSGWSVVGSSATAIAHGGHQFSQQNATDWQWTVVHYHNEVASLWVDLQWNGVGPLEPPTVTEQSCGGYATSPGTAIGSPVVITTPTGTPVGAGTSNYLQPAAAPSLVIEKALSTTAGAVVNSHVQDGELVSYSIKVSNIGDADDTGVVVCDPVPTHSTYESINGPGAQQSLAACSNGPGWNIGTLPAKSSQILSYTVRANGANTNVISNTASVTSNTFGTPITASATDVIIDAMPALVIEKDVNKLHPDAGEEITYKLRYANTGSAEATSVVIEDVLQSGLEYVTANPLPTSVIGGNTLQWALASPLAPNSQWYYIDITARVPVTASVGELFNNQATIRATGLSPVPSQEVIVDVRSAVPVLSLNKRFNPSTTRAGGAVTISLDCENIGSAAADQLILRDELPQGLTVESSKDGTVSNGGRTITWNQGTVAAHTSCSRTFTARVDPALGDTTLPNIAYVEAANAFQSPVSSTALLTVTASGVLDLKKTVDRAVVDDGDVLTYTLTYQNIGSADTGALTLTDLFLDYLDPTTVKGTGLVQSGNLLVWSLPALMPGQSNSVNFSVEVDATAGDYGKEILNLALINDASSSASASVKTLIQQLPALELNKRPSSPVFSVGQQASWVIEYRNVGNSTATGVEIIDGLPKYMTADVSKLPANASYDPGKRTITWSIGDLPVSSQAQQLKVPVVVSASAPNPVVQVNHATLRSNERPDLKVDASVSLGSSKLEISKVPDPTVVSPGQTVTYTITVKNVGTAPSGAVTLTDTLPDEMIALDSTLAYTVDPLNSNILTWTLPNGVAPGVPVSFTLDVQLDSPLANGTRLNNTVSVTSTTGQVIPPDPDLSNVVISSHSQLKVSKSIDNTSPSPGQLVTYTVSFDNVGNETAADVHLEDYFPIGVLDFVSTSAGQYAPDGNGRMLIQLGDLLPNSPNTVTVTGRVKAGTPDSTPFTNRATLGLTPSLKNSVTDAVGAFVSSLPNMAITKQLLTPSPNAGGYIRYRISVSNSGTADSGPLTVYDALNSGLTYVSAQPDAVQTAGGLEWPINSVAAGDTYEIDLTLQVPSPLPDQTVVTNFAALTGTGLNLLTQPVTVAVSSKPVLTIDKTAKVKRVEPGPTGCGSPTDDACLGGTVAYTIKVTNTGTTSATNVIVTDKLDAGLVPVLGGIGAPTLTAGILQWPAISLAAGQSHEFHLSARAISADALSDGDSLGNVATARSDQTSPVSDRVSVVADGTPLLELEKISSAGGHIGLDQQIVWTIRFRNAGTGDASNVRVIDVLPLISPAANAQIKDVAWSRTPDVLNGNVAEWNLGTLAAGDGGSLTITATVLDPGVAVADGTPLGNAAGIGAFTDNTYATLSYPPTTGFTIDRIVSKPVLSISKTSPTVHAQPGEDVSFTISYENTGTDVATGVTVTDQLNPYLEYRSADGSPIVNGQRVTWTLPPLAPHDPGTLTLIARIRSPVPNGTTINNVASISSNQTVPVTSPTGGPGTGFSIESHPALTLTKTPNLSVVKAGETITYDLVFENLGNDTAHAVLLGDQLPSYLKYVSATPASNGPADSSNTIVSGGGYVIWDLGDIKVGQKGSVSLTAEVVSPIADGTQLYNAALLSGTDDAAIDIARTPVSSKPVLAVSKVPDRAVVADGDLLTYHINYANNGTDTATGISLTDTLPAYTTFESADHNGTEAGGVVTWLGTDLTSTGDLAANDTGSVSVTVRVNLSGTVPNGTRIHNQAAFNATNAQQVSTASEVVVDSRPVLQLVDKVVSPQKFAAPNQQILYRLTYTNVGTDVATGLVLTDHFPAGAIPIVATDLGSFNTNTSTVTWHLSRLAPGQTVEVEYTLQVPPDAANGTSWITHSSLTASNAQPAAGSTRLHIASEPDMRVSKVGSSSVQAGNKATYRIDYQNVGLATATGVKIVDTLPIGWTLDAGSSTPGASGSSGTITWDVGNIPPSGSGGSIMVVANVPMGLADGTAWDNVGTVTGTNVVVVSNAQTTVIRSNPVLAVAITGAPDPVRAGDQVLFQVSYKNTGDADALATELVATIPPNTTYVAGSAPGAVYNAGARTLSWSLGTVGAYPPLAPMDSFTFLVDVASPLTDHTALTSRASIAANNAATQTASATVYVASQPLLLASKTVTPQQVKTGQVVTYTIKLQNIGTDTAVNITVSDTLPSGLRVLSADNGGAVDADTNTASWAIASLDPGDAELVFNATALVIGDGVINNVALISGTNIGGSINHVTSPASQLRSTFVPSSVPIPVLGEQQRWLLVALMILAAYVAHYRPVKRRKSL